MAAALTSGFGTVRDDDWPPQRFRKPGMFIVVYAADQAQIDKECGKAPKGFVTEGCSDDERIVLSDPCKFPATDDYARLTCHELGHRAGWPEDHPK